MTLKREPAPTTILDLLSPDGYVYTFILNTEGDRVVNVRTVLNEGDYPLDTTDDDVVDEALNPLLAELDLPPVDLSKLEGWDDLYAALTIHLLGPTDLPYNPHRQYNDTDDDLLGLGL